MVRDTKEIKLDFSTHYLRKDTPYRHKSIFTIDLYINVIVIGDRGTIELDSQALTQCTLNCHQQGLV